MKPQDGRQTPSDLEEEIDQIPKKMTINWVEPSPKKENKPETKRFP